VAAIEPERPNECPSCGEAVVEKRMTAPTAATSTRRVTTRCRPRSSVRRPPTFQTEVPEEKLEAVTEEGDDG
jgi:hypothetical protein